jgi:hypothetical protein
VAGRRSAASEKPHSWQNFTPGGFVDAQLGQVTSAFSGVPHSPQKFTPGGLLLPHDAQTKDCPLNPLGL